MGKEWARIGGRGNAGFKIYICAMINCILKKISKYQKIYNLNFL